MKTHTNQRLTLELRVRPFQLCGNPPLRGETLSAPACNASMSDKKILTPMIIVAVKVTEASY